MFLGISALKYVSKLFRNTDSILGRISCVMNRDNTIEVNSKDIDINNIMILWQPDFLDSQIVYKDGSCKSKIGYEYGQNYFQVNYNGIQISKVGHFKTNNWHSHDYKFEIRKDDRNYITKFKAIGPNSFEISDTTEL